jgi:hypothetical protein
MLFNRWIIPKAINTPARTKRTSASAARYSVVGQVSLSLALVTGLATGAMAGDQDACEARKPGCDQQAKANVIDWDDTDKQMTDMVLQKPLAGQLQVVFVDRPARTTAKSGSTDDQPQMASSKSASSAEDQTSTQSEAKTVETKAPSIDADDTVASKANDSKQNVEEQPAAVVALTEPSLFDDPWQVPNLTLLQTSKAVASAESGETKATSNASSETSAAVQAKAEPGESSDPTPQAAPFAQMAADMWQGAMAPIDALRNGIATTGQTLTRKVITPTNVAQTSADSATQPPAADANDQVKDKQKAETMEKTASPQADAGSKPTMPLVLQEPARVLNDKLWPKPSLKIGSGAAQAAKPASPDVSQSSKAVDQKVIEALPEVTEPVLLEDPWALNDQPLPEASMTSARRTSSLP